MPFQNFIPNIHTLAIQQNGKLENIGRNPRKLNKTLFQKDIDHIVNGLPMMATPPPRINCSRLMV